jgi:hypothetical protein
MCQGRSPGQAKDVGCHAGRDIVRGRERWLGFAGCDAPTAVAGIDVYKIHEIRLKEAQAAGRDRRSVLH